MQISYSAIWEDTVRLIRAHASLAIALAGVFLFLPGLLVGHFLPTPQATEADESIRQLGEHFRNNFHWLLLNGLLSMAGTLAILFLVLRGGATSVGTAIAAGFTLLIPYFIAAILTGIPIAIGFLLLIVPGLYLLGRFVPLAPTMVAEGIRNPLTAIGRTWRLTAGHGWAITGLFILVAVAGFILASVVAGIIAVILRIALPDDLSSFLGMVVSTAVMTALQVVIIFLYAAIYRRLAGRPAAAATAAGTGSADPGAVPPADGPR